MIVAFVHTKGGVGKTTSSVMTAAAAAAASEPVTLYDADPQRSALRWQEVAEQRDDPLTFSVVAATAKTLDGLDTAAGFSIIDTPPGTAHEIQAAIDVADLIVVPSGASPMDIDRVWPTLETTSHRMAGVLLTGVLMHTRLYAEARELLENEGVPTFYNAIPQREEMKAQFGTNPTKLHGYDDVYTEITEIEEF